MGEINIYKMGLHEDLRIDKYTYVKRVPGGWIYVMDEADSINNVFVPFNNEFMSS